MSELLKIAVVVSVASFLAVSPSALHAQSECNARQILQPGNCIGDDLDALEIELAKQINDYRLRNGLPAIPLSPALSLVANRHVRDLAMNIGRLTHDWSNCAMTDSNCMWKAPQRLGTSYPGNGFENAYGGPKGSRASPAAILESWKELVECPLESLRDRYLRRLRRHVGWIENRSDGWELTVACKVRLGLRRIDLVTAFLSERELHFRIELVRPEYIFTYTRLPARQIVPVTVVTKNANAIPIFLFVC